MTGDGVNDAPALKKADAGIAVSGATDAARAAADIVLLTPGLSVIIDAIQESRKIFQRMNSYAIYRIAETIRVLLFMTLSILVFNFYPVTAVMIVLLALLNDGAILSIAYDRVRYFRRAGGLGHADRAGAGFRPRYCRRGRFFRSLLPRRAGVPPRPGGDPDPDVPETLSGGPPDDLRHPYPGPFLVHPPGHILLLAVVGTQAVATLIAVYGLLMTPIGWGWALVVWGYALAWFLVNDRVKLLAYRILDSASCRFCLGKPEGLSRLQLRLGRR